jgi:hypothetical protein
MLLLSVFYDRKVVVNRGRGLRGGSITIVRIVSGDIKRISFIVERMHF